MNHITGGDILGGLGTSTFIALKLLFFTEATYHFALVGFDALLGGVIGLITVHYGKKLLKIFDEWVAKIFKKESE